MALINRLTGLEMVAGETKLPVQYAISVLLEYHRGHLSFEDVVSAFGLDEVETGALVAWMQSTVGAGMEVQEVENILLLGEAGVYDLRRVKDRLGLE